MMEERLWCEKSSSSLISTLPAWIIEYAWTKRMMEVLEVLGPPPWLEGDRSSLTLKDPCSIRVVAAESWMFIRARDMKHFERVMEFLDVAHNLLPQLVTPIKHMKIMFGLKTLVIMWMLWDDQSVASITNKIVKFFPDSIAQYCRSSRRHIELMQKAQRDFKNFAQLLTNNPEMRKNYITNMIGEQYGERYLMKLEERLLQYLEALNKALPRPTYIDQVLKQSAPLNGREELLQQLFTCNSASPTSALKKMLICAMKSHMDHKRTVMCKQHSGAHIDGAVFGPLCVALRPPVEEAEEDWLSKASSQSLWMKKDESLEKHMTMLTCVLDQTDGAPCRLKKQHPQTSSEIRRGAKKKKAEDDLTEHLCSKHGKRMRSILQECSEEHRSQDDEALLMQVECTPPLHQSSPQRQTPQHDTSSTNISPSSQPDSFSYLSVDEHRHVASQLVASSEEFSADEHNVHCMFGQKGNITLEGSPPGSQLVTSSRTCLVRPSSSQTSSSSTNISSFPENKLTPTASSTEQESSVKMCLESSDHVLFSSSSPSPPSSSAAPAVIFLENQNNAQVFLESSGTLAGQPRLSLDTQAFFLMCKWLQPQVKLYRLSQHDCQQPRLPNNAPEPSSIEELDLNVFDVNLLYSDSESDTHDSDDSDYIPSKRCRYM